MFMEPGAYDQAITVFSPDGRLLQVEYALEAVNHGTTVVGISCLEGVVLGAEKHAPTELQDPSFDWKIFEVDEHVGAAVVGLTSDARVLIDQARIYAQTSRLTYDEPTDVEVLAKRIGHIEQMYTQYAGVRPFGVSIILGGVSKNGNKLFMIDPSGSYWAYKAVAAGIGRETVEGLLKAEYRETLKLDETVKLAVKCLVEALRARGEKLEVNIVVIPSETKRLRFLTEEEIADYIKKL